MNWAILATSTDVDPFGKPEPWRRLLRGKTGTLKARQSARHEEYQEGTKRVEAEPPPIQRSPDACGQQNEEHNHTREIPHHRPPFQLADAQDG
jgi:hypothetical protein